MSFKLSTFRITKFDVVSASPARGQHVGISRRIPNYTIFYTFSLRSVNTVCIRYFSHSTAEGHKNKNQKEKKEKLNISNVLLISRFSYLIKVMTSVICIINYVCRSQ